MTVLSDKAFYNDDNEMNEDIIKMIVSMRKIKHPLVDADLGFHFDFDIEDIHGDGAEKMKIQPDKKQVSYVDYVSSDIDVQEMFDHSFDIIETTFEDGSPMFLPGQNTEICLLNSLKRMIDRYERLLGRHTDSSDENINSFMDKILNDIEKWVNKLRTVKVKNDSSIR
jgi:hypothetical protein